MASNKPARRMPLHQLLAHTEKHNRDIADFIHTELHVKIADLHELIGELASGGRVPPKSLHNSLTHLDESGTQLMAMLQEFMEALEAIHDHANRDRVDRLK